MYTKSSVEQVEKVEKNLEAMITKVSIVQIEKGKQCPETFSIKVWVYREETKFRYRDRMEENRFIRDGLNSDPH